MRFFESAHVRVITQSGDSLESVRALITSLCPVDWEKEKIVLDESTFTDAHEQERHVFELTLTKQRHVNAFSKYLYSQFTAELKNKLLAELPKQVDDESTFFVRFDLDALLDGEWKFTLDGRCLHLKMAVCAHPRKPEVAIDVVKNFLEQ